MKNIKLNFIAIFAFLLSITNSYPMNWIPNLEDSRYQEQDYLQKQYNEFIQKSEEEIPSESIPAMEDLFYAIEEQNIELSRTIIETHPEILQYKLNGISPILYVITRESINPYILKLIIENSSEEIIKDYINFITNLNIENININLKMKTLFLIVTWAVIGNTNGEKIKLILEYILRAIETLNSQEIRNIKNELEQYIENLSKIAAEIINDQTFDQIMESCSIIKHIITNTRRRRCIII